MTMYDRASAEIITFCVTFDYHLCLIGDGGRFALAHAADGTHGVAVFAEEMFGPGGFEQLREAAKSSDRILAHEVRALMFADDGEHRYVVLDCLDTAWFYIGELTAAEAGEWLAIVTAVARRDYEGAETLSADLAGRSSNPYLRLYPNLVRYERERYQGLLASDPACIARAINEALPISFSTSTPLLSRKGLLDDLKAGTSPETVGLFSDEVLGFLDFARDVMQALGVDYGMVDRELDKRRGAAS